ncbi:MAG TPA: sigma-70 family RNA polymerase sigma factor [Polyangia bacterium]|nr:sigma-70 family RNA polymerase sigma factor [Polyangia bacterium]
MSRDRDEPPSPSREDRSHEGRAGAGRAEGLEKKASEAGEGVVPMESLLVARARTGDAAAFRRLFERHGPAVRRFLRDLLRDEVAADEATQETFVRAFHRLGQLREDQKILAWLLGIARNVSHEELRRRRHHGLLPGAEGRDGDDGEEPATREPADVGPSPETLLLGHEADRQLAAALATLGEERRAALLLRLDHQLDYEEIRGVMGWSLAKVKNEIHRARLELRARLLPYLGGQ